MLTAKDLRELPVDQVQTALSELTPKQLQELQYTWSFWARPEQIPPKSKDWNTFLALAGRGWGKTRANAEWVREQVKSGKKRGAIVCSTNSDIEKVFVKGDSGILNCCWDGDKTHRGRHIGRPTWSPTKRTLFWWKDGQETGKDSDVVSKLECFSAEEPERLRGPQFEYAACDELCAWNKDEETWDMLQFCLRLGKHPRVFIATTPKSTKLLRKIMKDPKTVIATGSTFDNEANLADTYITAVKTQYEGTRLGRQELYAEVLTENEGALWTADMIDSCQVELEDVPDLERVIISVDPATTDKVESDETGIIVAGIDAGGNGYILEDHTFKDLPERWAQKAIELYHHWGASRIVFEKNQGGDMIPPLFRTIDENIPLKGVFASHSKVARAEPVSSLYERGKVFHVRNPQAGQSLSELETQMTTFEPMGKHKSPDRYDAMVWAITELMLGGYARPKLTLVSSTKESLERKE